MKDINKRYCIDCNKEITKGSKLGRCKSCENKRRFKFNIMSNNWRKGKKNRKHSERMKGIKNPNYTHGKPKCIDCGKEIDYYAKRCSHCAKTGKNSPNFGKIPKHLKRIKYKEFLMRSSYEVAYANYLDQKGIKWGYEPKTFDLGNTTYTPDFYLPKTDTYIEIKGWFRDRDKLKMKLFMLKYPKEKIHILFKNDLINLGVI